jgi:hypothetical protein
MIGVLAIAGCGGGGSDSGSGEETSSSSSKAAYIKSADAICTEAEKEVKAQFAAYLKKIGVKKIGESGAKAEAQAVGAMKTVAIPAFNQQIEELKALEAPRELQTKANEYVTAAEAALEKGEGEPLLIYVAMPKLFAGSDKIAKEIGFQVCGNH